MSFKTKKISVGKIDNRFKFYLKQQGLFHPSNRSNIEMIHAVKDDLGMSLDSKNYSLLRNRLEKVSSKMGYTNQEVMR